MKKLLMLFVLCAVLLSVAFAHWADSEIGSLIKNDVLSEEDPLLENLDVPITRFQIVRVAMRLIDGEDSQGEIPKFSDVPMDHADYDSVTKAAQNGIINGFSDGTFRGDETVTRQDFFTIIGRAYELSGETEHRYTDDADVADYSRPYLSALHVVGLVKGYPDGRINPCGEITVAEALVILQRADEYKTAQEVETPPTEEKPKPSYGGGGGGGLGSGGVAVPDLIPPKIEYTLSTTEEDAERIEVTVKITDDVKLWRTRWFAIPLENEFYHAENGVDSAYWIWNSGIDFVEPETDEDGNIVGDEKCGGHGAQYLLQNYWAAMNRSSGWENVEENEFSDNVIALERNGSYFIYAIDVDGNVSVEHIRITNIKQPQITVETELLENPIDGTVATVTVTTDVQPNETYFVKGLLEEGDSIEKTPGIENSLYAELVEQLNQAREENSLIQKSGECYFIETFGEYTIVVFDEKGNWTKKVITIEAPPESPEEDTEEEENQTETPPALGVEE